MRGKEEHRIGCFVEGLCSIKLNAGATYIVKPHKDHASPQLLEEITSSISNANPGKSEQELVSELAEALSFNESQLKELEMSTRAQAGSLHWKQQRIRCTTALKIKDVSSKVMTMG